MHDVEVLSVSTHVQAVQLFIESWQSMVPSTQTLLDENLHSRLPNVTSYLCEA